MKQLTIEAFKAMLDNALKQIKAREEEFSKLDAVIGDGDHGTAIVAAMTAVNKSAQSGTEFKQMLGDMGMDVMMEVSGSTSTLLGAFFLGMSDHAEGTELDAAGVKAMFAGGLANVQQQTQAKRGDKTMMDALIPAVEAMQACTSDDIKVVLNAGAKAALEGAEATVPMKANFGRAVTMASVRLVSLIAGLLLGAVCSLLLLRRYKIIHSVRRGVPRLYKI